MNLIELSRALHQLRLGGMVAVLETRLLQAQTENMAPIDILSILVSDEIACRSKRLLDRKRQTKCMVDIFSAQAAGVSSAMRWRGVSASPGKMSAR